MASRLRADWPLHWAVWENDYQSVSEQLSASKADLDKFDPRGRTPLLLAVTLGHIETAKVLLDAHANVNVESKDGWTAVQEATAFGDRDLLKLLLKKREEQRHNSRLTGIPALLKKLEDAPDFYVEMKWEFASWVPLVSRMCPSDTYKIYKRGSSVRIDTTLLGFDQNSWQRGSRTYVFKSQEEGTVMMVEIDHDSKRVYTEPLADVLVNPDVETYAATDSVFEPSEKAIQSRLKSPIVTTYIDTEKISFERNKSGIWGWRSDKTEEVNGKACKVFGAQNVELVTKTRTEHLSEADKKAKAEDGGMLSPIQTLMGLVHGASGSDDEKKDEKDEENTSRPVTAEEYFDSKVNLRGRTIGPKSWDSLEKVQRFRATLWLCEDYPLLLPEQILPIVDLMAISSAHFAKLKEFIQLQLPTGFPVKIEIPLFHVLNARITFGNIFASETPVTGVTCIEEDTRMSCYVDDSVFDAPAGYQRRGSADDIAAEYHPYIHPRLMNLDEDDGLLQFAIQQSLMESGTEDDVVDVWEALNIANPDVEGRRGSSRGRALEVPEGEDVMIQRAIAESLLLSRHSDPQATGNHVWPEALAFPAPEPHDYIDDDLKRAVELSLRSAQEDEARRKREEEEELENILQMSLKEK